MVLNLTNRSTNGYLTTLSQVNDDLTNALDYELEKLKREEKQLQDALRLKTRLDLLQTIDKELKMNNDLSENADFDSLGLDSSSAYLLGSMQAKNALSTNYNLSESFKTTASLDDKIRLSEESLTKSYLLLDKLNKSLKSSFDDQCLICEHPLNKTTNSPVDTNEFLKKTVYSNLNNNRSYSGIFNNTEPVRPNVIFGKSKRSSFGLPNETTKSRVRLQMKPSNQNLNQQQTLSYDPRFGLTRTKSDNEIVRASKSAKFNLNTTGARDSYTQTNVFTRLSPNKTDPVIIPKSYMRLPVARTLIHDQPWRPGKVQTNYYQFRDSKLNRSTQIL